MYGTTPTFSQETKTNILFTAAKTIPTSSTLLMVVSIDTTGWTSGSWTLALTGGAQPNTTIGGKAVVYTPVQLTIASQNSRSREAAGATALLIPGLLKRRCAALELNFRQSIELAAGNCQHVFVG